MGDDDEVDGKVITHGQYIEMSIYICEHYISAINY